ncbi:MATE family efflux transporter [Rhodovarius lipocyclicus]|uniref:MATE family efflux transporter n=1 Tax=Rhodovarius lipocyclicus TaxID=268410 RepID=UPI0013584A1F|nr:MATE family efflux transporter [Rhodovarius lipocyclicus]
MSRPSTAEIARGVLKLAAPTTMLSLMQAFALLVETFIAARLGRGPLAGYATVLPFALLLGQMSAGAMGGGVVSAIARALGARREDEASAMVKHALTIALCFAGGFILAMVVLPHLILGAIGGAAAAEYGAPFAMVYFGLGAVPAWLANTLASVLRGGGRHGIAARVNTLAWMLSPLLGWVLALPLGLGLPGLGIGFGVAMWAAAIAQSVMVWRGGAGFRPNLSVPFQGALFRRILSVGAVACALAAVSNLTTILVTAQLKGYGPAAVAAYGVSARLEFLMIPLAFGVGSALTALVGRAVGGGDWELARRTAWVGGGMAFAVCALVGGAVAIFPGGFAGVFASDPEVKAIAELALSCIGPAFAGFGLGMAMYFAAMGAGRMRWPVAAGLSRLGLAVLGGAFLGQGLGMGLVGHFLAVAAGITAYGLIAAAAVQPREWAPRLSVS